MSLPSLKDPRELADFRLGPVPSRTLATANGSDDEEENKGSEVSWSDDDDDDFLIFFPNSFSCSLFDEMGFGLKAALNQESIIEGDSIEAG